MIKPKVLPFQLPETNGFLVVRGIPLAILSQIGKVHPGFQTCQDLFKIHVDMLDHETIGIFMGKRTK